MAFTLMAQVAPGQAAQFVINDGHELVEGIAVALLPAL